MVLLLRNAKLNILTTIISSVAIAAGLIGMTPVRQAKVSKEVAATKCRDFLKVAGLRAPQQTLSVRQMPAYTGFKGEWEVTFVGEYRFAVRQADGLVTAFDNDRRTHQQFKRTMDRSRVRYRNAQQARPRLETLARKLGLRSQAKLERVDYVRDGDAEKTDANRAGSIHAKYRSTPFGYHFFGPVIGNGLELSIDPVDGELVAFVQSWDIKIESHAVRVSRTKAIANAETVFRPYRKKHRSPRSTADQPVTKVELKYVLPNAAYGSTHPNRQPERVARLAYIVYFGEESVWIDSATGKLLGGESFV